MIPICLSSAILSIYLKYLFVGNGMPTDEAEDTSTIIYHAFVFMSYFTSLFGAFLADSFLGKFKTIFYISIVYAIGQITLSLGAVPDTAMGIPGMPQE
jgi:dipeptide/tripeptide permease